MKTIEPGHRLHDRTRLCPGFVLERLSLIVVSQPVGAGVAVYCQWHHSWDLADVQGLTRGAGWAVKLSSRL